MARIRSRMMGDYPSRRRCDRHVLVAASASTGGRITSRTRSASARTSAIDGSALAGGLDRIVHDQRDVAGPRRQLALLHHVTAADDRDRHDRQARLHRQHDAAALELAHAAGRGCACPRERRSATARSTSAALAQPKMPARSGLAAIDQHVAGALQVRAEHRKAAERFLRDDAQLKRDRPEQHRDVVDALVVRDEHVGLAGRRRDRGRSTVTSTPVVARISHDHARAQPCAK